MHKKYLRYAIVLFVVVLVLLAHFGARLVAVETFSFADTTREIYLTFDDGPSTVVTNRILDILKTENIKATFFVVGDRIHGREETLRRIAAEGHTIGVHSTTHLYRNIYSSEEAFLKDVQGCAEIIRKVSGVTPAVYRFPGGGTHEREEELLRGLGYTVVGWNAVCGDEEIPHADAATLIETACKTSKNKSTVVMLLHDSASHTATADALPEIIARFRADGYVFRAY